MKKIILAVTSLLVIFSASSYAELENYFVKQDAKAVTQVAKSNPDDTQSVNAPFKTDILNQDPRITNN